MARVYRKTTLEARALVSDGGKPYLLSERRRALLRSQHEADLTAEAVPESVEEVFSLSGKEPIIDCIRATDAGYVITTGDFNEVVVGQDQLSELLAD